MIQEVSIDLMLNYLSKFNFLILVFLKEILFNYYFLFEMFLIYYLNFLNLSADLIPMINISLLYLHFSFVNFQTN